MAYFPKTTSSKCIILKCIKYLFSVHIPTNVFSNDKIKGHSIISQQLIFILSSFIRFWFCSNLLDNSNEVQLYSSRLQLRAMTGTRFVQI